MKLCGKGSREGKSSVSLLCPPQAFRELLDGGRLSEEQTDVSLYQVDGRLQLAELCHGLRRHYYWSPSYGLDGGPASNAALAITADTPSTP